LFDIWIKNNWVICSAEADDIEVAKRFTFVKRLYKGANLKGAVDDVGKSASTGSRRGRRWKEDGLEQLTPNLGE
jgi:transposase